MRLENGTYDVPPGKLAEVVTHLEMRARPALRADPPGPPETFRHVARPASDWYRALNRRIGEAYLWGWRLAMPEAELRAILDDPLIEIYALGADGNDVGLCELDFRVPDACEIVTFGIAPEAVGSGAGRRLMNRALERAWSRPLERCWLHTCSLDHPGALDFYRRSGFRPYRRTVFILDDPRSLGVLPADAAPGIPLL